jgi:hypothetical protein
MSREHFERSLKWCEYFDQTTGNQIELSLTGIGEPTLHPEITLFARMARDTLPDAMILFSTNGLTMTDDLARGLAEVDCKVDISLHRPEKARPAIEIAQRHRILHSVNPGATISSFNWGGQVDWPVTAPITTCRYLSDGWGCVLVDGRITTCCMDADGSGVVGHVDDAIGTEWDLKPYALCDGCHLERPK